MKEEKAKAFAIIACDVLENEVKARMERFSLKPEFVRYLEMGKHDHPETLRQDLQAEIEAAEEQGCERIIFVYGLCSNSILGVSSRRAELVFPRAHDCITLFLGSKERYTDIQKENPGTYWFSPGWCRGGRVPGPDHLKEMEARFREKFDEDEVEFLMEMERTKYEHYSVAAYTDLGDGSIEDSKAKTKAAAELFDMKYRHYEGEESLLNRLLTGPWDTERFLIVPPGKTARYTGDATIIKCGDCPARH